MLSAPSIPPTSVVKSSPKSSSLVAVTLSTFVPVAWAACSSIQSPPRAMENVMTGTA